MAAVDEMPAPAGGVHVHGAAKPSRSFPHPARTVVVTTEPNILPALPRRSTRNWKRFAVILSTLRHYSQHPVNVSARLAMFVTIPPRTPDQRYLAKNRCFLRFRGLSARVSAPLSHGDDQDRDGCQTIPPERSLSVRSVPTKVPNKYRSKKKNDDEVFACR